MKIKVLTENKKTKVTKPGQKRVSKKIGYLVGKEDMKPDQAAAIAYSMEKRGELKKGGKHSVEELLTEIDFDIANLVPKDDLNRKFWNKNDEIEPKIREKLLQVAEDFAVELKIDDKVKDVIFTGSLASYNWHKRSDIDLHIVIDMDELNGNDDFVEGFLTSQRSNWNKLHNIIMKEHEVEIYVQDQAEKHHANGVYSLKNDEWIKKPSKEEVSFDFDQVLKKAQGLHDDIDDVSDMYRGARYREAVEFADKLKTKLKKMRASGLARDGIYSVENLAFKLLRNNDKIERLYSVRTMAYDKMMSYSDPAREIDVNINENWKSFLKEQQITEKLMLKPGPNGWDLYSKLVAEAYLAAPKFESRAVRHFQAMIPFVQKMFKQIQSKVDVQFVDYHAYNSVEELRSDVFNNGVMKIATVDAEHDVFDPETNAKFRAVHDYMSHIQAIGSRGTDFSLKGEIQSYNTHLKTMPPESWPALFTEIVGQASTYFHQGGQFAEQKIALLDGFDYENIGVVEGYDIVNKELVKKDKMVAESPKNQGIDKHIDAETQDSGRYQQSIVSDYNQDRKDYLFLGNNKDTGGGKGHSSATKKRSKSAPPVAEMEKPKEFKIKINFQK
tara:strand:+ start:269 stop:2104 length:1836 start_codon:yes stop_codon:yes gene_type:complete